MGYPEKSLARCCSAAGGAIAPGAPTEGIPTTNWASPREPGPHRGWRSSTKARGRSEAALGKRARPRRRTPSSSRSSAVGESHGWMNHRGGAGAGGPNGYRHGVLHQNIQGSGGRLLGQGVRSPSTWFERLGWSDSCVAVTARRAGKEDLRHLSRQLTSERARASTPARQPLTRPTTRTGNTVEFGPGQGWAYAIIVGPTTLWGPPSAELDGHHLECGRRH